MITGFMLIQYMLYTVNTVNALQHMLQMVCELDF